MQAGQSFSCSHSTKSGFLVSRPILFCLLKGIDPPDLQREKEGIAALQELELKVDHSVSLFHKHNSSGEVKVAIGLIGLSICSPALYFLVVPCSR